MEFWQRAGGLNIHELPCSSEVDAGLWLGFEARSHRAGEHDRLRLTLAPLCGVAAAWWRSANCTKRHGSSPVLPSGERMLLKPMCSKGRPSD